MIQIWQRLHRRKQDLKHQRVMQVRDLELEYS